MVGGIAKSCEELMNSEFVEFFDICKVDSTQRSNPAPNAFFRFLFAIVRLQTFTAKLFRYRPQGVLLFFSSGMSFYEKMLMSALAKLFGAVVFLFPRAGALMRVSSESKVITDINRILYRSGDVFLAQGPSWETYAIEGCGFQAKNTQVVPNWTASDKYYQVGAARFENLTETPIPTIAFAGWLEVEKGIRELMEACVCLAREGLQFKCVLAGDGSQKRWIEEFIIQHSLVDVVDCKGWLHCHELQSHYRNADIFVLPSWSEGMPNSLIEAMSSGLCPVVTSVGIIPDFVHNGEHGVLVQPHSAQDLTDALRLVITAPDLRADYAKSAYLLSQQFDKDRVIPHLCDIIFQKLSK